MNRLDNDRNAWGWPNLMLWALCLGVGLVPDKVFYLFRDIAAVPTQRALVNHPMMISVALAIYVALFVLRQCRLLGCEESGAEARALQAGVIALVAFLPGVVDVLFAVGDIADPRLRRFVYLAGAGKLTCWFYLSMLMFRCYALGHHRAFVTMLLGDMPRERQPRESRL